jgi:hypothetical protein
VRNGADREHKTALAIAAFWAAVAVFFWPALKPSRLLVPDPWELIPPGDGITLLDETCAVQFEEFERRRVPARCRAIRRDQVSSR